MTKPKKSRRLNFPNCFGFTVDEDRTVCICLAPELENLKFFVNYFYMTNIFKDLVHLDIKWLFEGSWMTNMRIKRSTTSLQLLSSTWYLSLHCCVAGGGGWEQHGGQLNALWEHELASHTLNLSPLIFIFFFSLCSEFSF